MPRETPRFISIRGARQHNLQGVDVDIPVGALTVITGVSGSGKSSLAFDTLYAEGQRRYVESFSAYARQFLDRMKRPNVERIDGVLPAVAIGRSNPFRGARSTVASLCELTDHLRVLFARAAFLHCTSCGKRVEPEHPQAVIGRLLSEARGRKAMLGFELPLTREQLVRGGLNDLQSSGLFRVVQNGRAVDIAADGSNWPEKGPGFVLVDRVIIGRTARSRLEDSLQTSFRGGRGTAYVLLLGDGDKDEEQRAFREGLICAACGTSHRPPTPRMFSSSSPVGACGTCNGFGRVTGIDWDLVVPIAHHSLKQGAVRPFQTPSMRRHRSRLLQWCVEQGIDVNKPWSRLKASDRKRILQGGDGWKGVAGVFDALKRKSYKVHVRVLLSRYRGYPTCPDCEGTRLAPQGRAWTLGNYALPDVLAMRVNEACAFFQSATTKSALTDALDRVQREVVRVVAEEVLARLTCLQEVGLGYITLDRTARTLSGGEIQRVHLTGAIGSRLVNTLFVLDEPSVGLHARDNERLLRVLRRLVGQGNTVVVVEHDPAILRAADFVVDIGPHAGRDGGRVVAMGAPADIAKNADSITGAWLTGARKATPHGVSPIAKSKDHRVGVAGASANNLKGVDLLLSMGRVTALTGVSGSGKSTLAHDVLYMAMARALGRPEQTPGSHIAVVGVELLDDVILVEQAAAGRTSRANAATYLGAWDGVRKLFSGLDASVEAGFTASTFSFNVRGGRCEACGGAGVERIDMQFLSDVDIECSECAGLRFRPDVLSVRYRGHSIGDVLGLTAREARDVFGEAPKSVRTKVLAALDALRDVGLEYLTLGQSLNTLSSGEWQRLRLALALQTRKPKKPSLYIFDEPTTGLHMNDVDVLGRAIHHLAARGHAVLVVEHNLDFIRGAHRVIDLGPEGGDAGGEIVADGTPAEVSKGSGHTAVWLRKRPARLKRTTKARGSKRASQNIDAIEIRGAREHNLRDVKVDVPRGAFVVVSGPSGSGKSTLAFDVLFAEGQRRYIETLSVYARQFLGQLGRPDVDRVAGVPPTIAISQRRSRGGRRSTVATMTEIAHFLRLFYARAGVAHCPSCDRPLETLSERVMATRIVDEYQGQTIQLWAPRILGRKGFHRDLFEQMARRGHATARVDERIVACDPPPKLDRYREHDIDEWMGSLNVTRRVRPGLEALIAATLIRGNGSLVVTDENDVPRRYSSKQSCPYDGTAVRDLEPRLFSHNSKRGWCPNCRGLGTEPTVDASLIPIAEDKTLAAGAITPLGIEPSMRRKFNRDAKNELGIHPRTVWSSLTAAKKRVLIEGNASKGFEGARSRLERYFREGPEGAADWFGDYVRRVSCSACSGERLRPEARAVRVGDKRLPELLHHSIGGFDDALKSLVLSGRQARIGKPVLRGIHDRAAFMERMGLGYLTLDRDARTLSGGESQRLRLAAQMGSTLRGVCYVLDEPTIGLHARDNARLLRSLQDLRARGNSLVVVEHDLDTIRAADRLIDLGPGGGRLGGRIVAEGTPSELAHDPDSPTGRVLQRTSPTLNASTVPATARIKLSGVTLHNLKCVNVEIPLNRFVCVTGVSGAGKSTLMHRVLVPALNIALNKKTKRKPTGPFRSISGYGALTRVVEVDSAPIGKTPRSVPATYLGMWTPIRKALALTPEARVRGYGPGRFSFNTREGRCPECDGMGERRIEMSFLPGVRVPCETCEGLRFDPETLDIRWKGRNAGELLAMSFEEATSFYEGMASIRSYANWMHELGMGYLALGQPSPTLSGGEAQRVKLVSELGKESTSGATLYVLDEPTIGLHGEDVDRLVAGLRKLVERGHTVVVIEHNLELIATADHVIDLGPEGGDGGGRVVACGTPKDVSRVKKDSHTAKALRGLSRARMPGSKRKASSVPKSRTSTPSRS